MPEIASINAPASEPRPSGAVGVALPSGISRVAIVGAGVMGRRIAFGCIVGGKEVRLHDTAPAALVDALAWIGELLTSWSDEARLTPAQAAAARSRLELLGELRDCVVGADLVIESVPENLELKRRVFAEIDRHMDEQTIVVSNTSSIPSSRFADAVRRPENVVSANFGHVHHLKVEVMGHPGTAPIVLVRTVALIRELGLVPIRVRREIQGYATNRVWRAVKKEVLHLLDGGYLTADDVDRAWMLDWGTAIGPCGLMDRIGLDVVRDIEISYYQESEDPTDRPPPLLDAMVAAGKLGEKTGEGFFRYPYPAYSQVGWLTGSPP